MTGQVIAMTGNPRNIADIMDVPASVNLGRRSAGNTSALRGMHEKRQDDTGDLC